MSNLNTNNVNFNSNNTNYTQNMNTNSNYSNKIQKLVHLCSLVNPEKEKSFEYLSKYFNYTKLSQIEEEKLIKKEKVIHDMILHPEQHNLSKFDAWCTYTQFVNSITLPKSNDIRGFLVLEYLSRNMIYEKDLYLNYDFMSRIMQYAEKCADDIDFAIFLKKSDICTKNYFLYYSLAIFYEKNHEFKNANKCYLEGLDKKVDKAETLQTNYKQFEARMKNRVEREINNSIISKNIINSHVNKELAKLEKNQPDRNENNKRVRTWNDEDDDQDLFNMNNLNHKKKKIDLNSTHSTVRYGEIPVYVDEPFRKHVISEGTKVVQTYEILFNFLIEHDTKFKIQNDEYDSNLKKDYNSRPFSWTNKARLIPEKIAKSLSGVDFGNSINDNNINSEFNNYNNTQAQSNPNEIENVIKNMLIENKQKEEANKIQAYGVIKNKEKEYVPSCDIISNNEDVKFENGQKIRVVKVETKKKEFRMLINVDKLLDENNNYFNLEEKRAKMYFEKIKAAKEAKEAEERLLREKELKEKELKKRKTIVYKVDSDGDMCMDSDEEDIKDSKDNYFDKKVEKKNINTVNKMSNLNPQPQIQSKIQIEKNCKNNNNSYNNQTKNTIHVSQDLNYKKIINNLNLFAVPLTLDEINEKIKDIERMQENNLINEKQADVIYTYFEEKINELAQKTEEIEYEKQKQNKNKHQKVVGFAPIIPKPDAVNPFLPNKNPSTKSNKSNELLSYLTNNNVPNANKYINTNHVQANHAQPLLELPNKKIFDNQPSNSVSRSLDFTNIKFLDSDVKNDIKETKGIPFSSLFNLNEDEPKKPNNNNNNANNKKEEFSISFDSEHSHFFQNPLDLLNDDNYTPTKNTLKTFNLVDTPALIKKVNLFITI